MLSVQHRWIHSRPSTTSNNGIVETLTTFRDTLLGGPYSPAVSRNDRKRIADELNNPVPHKRHRTEMSHDNDEDDDDEHSIDNESAILIDIADRSNAAGASAPHLPPVLPLNTPPHHHGERVRSNNNNRQYTPPHPNSLDEIDEFRAEALFSTISSSTISSSDSFDMNNESRWNSDMSGGAVGAYMTQQQRRSQAAQLHSPHFVVPPSSSATPPKSSSTSPDVRPPYGFPPSMMAPPQHQQQGLYSPYAQGRYNQVVVNQVHPSLSPSLISR